MGFAMLLVISAFAALHSFLLSSKKPLPLQEFCPLQELLAVLQADWPLQELTPAQCAILADVPADAVGMIALANSSATAEATATPV